MISLGSISWGSSPTIPIAFAYEKQRSGSNMQYRVQVTVSPVIGSSYFGYPIYLGLTINGDAIGTVTLKAASPTQWTSAITYTSSWYTVSNKTSGTTSVAFNIYSGMGSTRNNTYSYSMAVDPATSTMSVSNGTLGSALNIAVTRYSTGFTHTITYTCGSASGVICDKSTANPVAWNTSNGNTLALASQNTTGWSVNVSFTITTYNGSTVVGTYKTSNTMIIPSSVKPSVALKVEDAAGYFATYGAYVQGRSKLKITATPTQAYGSPITSCAIAADGKIYTESSLTTGVIYGKGSIPVSTRVTDARGSTSDTAITTITVLEYSKPAVTAIAYRCNSSGAADPEGAYMRVGFTSTIVSLNGKNSARFSITYSSAVGSNTITGTGTSYTSNVIASDVAQAWSVEVTVFDNFDSTTKAAVVTPAFTLLDFFHTGRGIAFGQIATRDGFDCAMNAYFGGSVTLSNGFVDGTDTGWVALNDCVSYRYKCGYVTVKGLSGVDGAARMTLIAGDYKEVGVVPGEYKPMVKVPLVFHTVGGSPISQSGFVDANGQIRLYSNVGGTEYWAFTVTYPI